MLNCHFYLDVIGILKTKITNSNENNAHPSILGYVFEHVSTALTSGDAGQVVVIYTDFFVNRYCISIMADDDV